MEATPRVKAKKVGGKGKQNTIVVVQQDFKFDSGDEELITTVGLQDNHSIHASSSFVVSSHDYDKRRTKLFRIRVVEKHTKVETLFDLCSQVILIFELVVKNLRLYYTEILSC